VSEPFYTPEICCGVGGSYDVGTGSDGNNAIVVSVGKQRKTTAPPKLYDLTTLQRDPNRLFGFTAQQALACTP